MSAAVDRRNPHIHRVPLTKLVDICSTAGSLGPFQGESTNLSGRGMQVSTSHLPELGAELVCRFEHAGHEVLVEGRVAWRAETEVGGEFGVQFTALDPDSTEVLRELGMRKSGAQARASAALLREADEAAERAADASGQLDLAVGHRVKLHMAGLAAPMKAAVHTVGERRIRVGSNLEFLKVGRVVELEDLAGGGRRGALIDAVNVIINPSTLVPELVVQLKYEGLSPTPAPVRAEERGADYEDEAFRHGDDEELGDDGPLYPAAEAVRERLAAWMSTAGQAASKVGGAARDVLGRAGVQARGAAEKSALSWSKVRAQSVRTAPSAAGARRSQTPRRTSAAPSHLRSGIHALGLTGKERKATSARRTSVVATVPPRTSRWLLGGVMLTLALGSAGAIRAFSGEEADVADKPGTALTAPAAPAAHLAAPPVAVSAAATAPKPPTEPSGVMADVPLFGPRSLAAAEPVAATAVTDDATAERLAAAAATPDQSWDEEPAPEAPAAKEDAEPWGRGRLHLPTVHRIRLDATGATLAGAVEQDGFVVVIPGRKSMESGRAIQKRDKRIMAVSTANTAEGARVRFTFRGSVPPYRVRLRNDFVEFLISAPAEGLAQL